MITVVRKLVFQIHNEHHHEGELKACQQTPCREVLELIAHGGLSSTTEVKQWLSAIYSKPKG